ncbi:MAG: uncharacterized protein JWR26_118 [Pedosphaera sp.]|nr:uncharacterized protein [Pedosphaera sp.]
MFIYKSRFLTRGEVWFDDEADDTPVDWIYYRQRPTPVANTKWKYFYTLLIDLAKSPDQLMGEMDEKTVQKIKDAEEKDQTSWKRCDARESKILDDVERMWNQFAAAQKSPPLDRAWLDKIIEAGALELSAATDPAGEVLTYHLSYAGKKWARDLIVVSRYSSIPNTALRNRINRANCLGHWKTLLTLQARGLRYFDFGGWHLETKDLRLLGMNAFKKGFGGQVVREFECEEIRTVKGWLVLTTARILNRARSVRTGRSLKSQNTAHATTPQDRHVSPAI